MLVANYPALPGTFDEMFIPPTRAPFQT